MLIWLKSHSEMQRTEKTDNIENSNIRKYQIILETSTISKFALKYVNTAQNILQNANNTVIFPNW